VGEEGEHLPVTVSRSIGAPASAIFAVLCDPRRHPEIDGSGMLQRAVTTGPIGAVGDRFVMAMRSRTKGRYEIVNHVVEFEVGRRLAWEPQAGRGLPEAGTPRMGHRWAYLLHADGSSLTTVTHLYDCSRLPVGVQRQVQYGELWRDAMETTLTRLEAACTGART
jgi:hypothetical protein